MQHNWKYTNQVAGCQNRHEPNKLATLLKKRKTRGSAIAERPRCRVRYSFRQQ